MYPNLSAVLLTSAVAVTNPQPHPLPPPVKAIIEAALQSGKDSDILAVERLTKQTNPNSVAEISTLFAGYHTQKAEAAKKNAEAEQKAKLAKQQAAEAKLRGGVFDHWSGRGRLGGSRSTGNTDSLGLNAGLDLRKEGRNWRHELRGNIDLHETNGRISREQYAAAYEPNYKFHDRLFAYGLVQYEHDRFAGFAARYTLSGGLGYTVVKTPKMTFSVNGGPSWRFSELTNGGTTSDVAALAGLDFSWQLAPNLKITETGDAYLQDGNSTFHSTTAINSKLIENLSA